MSYKQGDIVWVNYPFSDDFAKSKKRPAIVVSNEKSNALDNDLLIVPITTSIRGDTFSYKLESSDLVQPLPFVSEVRCNKIITIRKRLILAPLSSLKEDSLSKIIQKIISVFQ